MFFFDSKLTSSFFFSDKQKNAVFDNVFYDTGSLSNREKDRLSVLGNPGSVIVVAPGQSENGIHTYKTVTKFLESNHNKVQALVIAGVGSSAIGTAALARNVADAYDIEVAGIVSGYDEYDLLSETMGNWLYYGINNTFQQQLQHSLEAWDLFLRLNPFYSYLKDRPALLPVVEEVNMVASVLEALATDLSLVVGHSKGNLLLDAALSRITEKLQGRGHRYFEELNIVTLGAVTHFPPQFKKISQFIGSIDWFGGINSRLDVDHNKVLNAWHHLNPLFPYHLSAEAVLREHVCFR